MDRREALRACFGAAVLAVGGSLIGASAAEARIASPGPLPSPEPAAEPAVATEADLDSAQVENVWHRGYPHRGWYRRRRRYWRRRYYGYPYWRRRRFRRCWINRRGYRVCRW